jgi:hypothetical protein
MVTRIVVRGCLKVPGAPVRVQTSQVPNRWLLDSAFAQPNLLLPPVSEVPVPNHPPGSIKGPDLLISNFWQVGTSCQLHLVVKNQGNAGAGISVLTVDDDNDDASPQIHLKVMLQPIAAGGTQNVTVETGCQGPPGIGNKRYFNTVVDANKSVAELNEKNNTRQVVYIKP